MFNSIPPPHVVSEKKEAKRVYDLYQQSQSKGEGESYKWFASSKTCSDCGFVNKNLSLEDRTWICENCGSFHDRDFNASVNIEREGTSSLGLDHIRPPLAALVA